MASVSSPQSNLWLHRYCVLLCAATLGLLCIGGLVTSKGVGMAVPDWPNTYGYNMFLFPISQWVGGIFYEHTHRLAASGVGFLTVILALWLWIKEPRRWMKRLGAVALLAVILQGVLGGLRVTLIKDEIGIFHGTLAQLFFSLTAALVVFTSPWWRQAGAVAEDQALAVGLQKKVLILTGVILFQLVLGATMRHQHAGLAIPDFPLAYGTVYPDTDVVAINRYNHARMETTAVKPITAFQVHLQMAHRLTALLILVGAGWVWRSVRAAQGSCDLVLRFSNVWLGLICAQAALGAATIWSGKSADVATSHMAFGALSLMTGCIFSVVLGRLAWLSRGGSFGTPVR